MPQAASATDRDRTISVHILLLSLPRQYLPYQDGIGVVAGGAHLAFGSGSRLSALFLAQLALPLVVSDQFVQPHTSERLVQLLLCLLSLVQLDQDLLQRIIVQDS